MYREEKSQIVIKVWVLTRVCRQKKIQKFIRFAVLCVLVWQVRVNLYAGEHLEWIIVTHPFFVTSIIIIQV